MVNCCGLVQWTPSGGQEVYLQESVQGLVTPRQTEEQGSITAVTERLIVMQPAGATVGCSRHLALT